MTLTPEQELRVAALRAALPPLVVPDAKSPDGLGDWGAAFTDTVCLDCEWDTSTGALTTIGVGNESLVVQIDWTALGDNDFLKHEVRFAVDALIRRVPVVYQNASADIRKLREHGFKIHPTDHLQLDDTMLADAVVNSELDHDLGALNERYGALPPYKDLRLVAPAEYNAADLVATVQVWRRGLLPALKRDPAAECVYREQSLAFLREIQIETEEAGIRVDKTRPYPLRDKYATKIEQAQRLALASSGWPLNLKSPDDLKHWLYVVEGLPEQRKKAPRGVVGELTTDKDAIAALRRLQGTEWDADVEPTLEQAMANVEEGAHGVLEAKYLQMNAQQILSHYLMPVFEVEAINAR